MQHAELVANPFAATVKLYNDLVAAGVAGLTLPTEAQVGRLLRPSTEHAHTYLASERAAVGPSVHALSMALSSADRLPAAQLPRASWHVAERKESEAIATLLTTDNRDYLRGALVLGSSIRSFDSSRDMVRGVAARAPPRKRPSPRELPPRSAAPLPVVCPAPAHTIPPRASPRWRSSPLPSRGNGATRSP